MKLTKQQLLKLDQIKKSNPELVEIVNKFREHFGAVQMVYLKVGEFELGEKTIGVKPSVQTVSKDFHIKKRRTR